MRKCFNTRAQRQEKCCGNNSTAHFHGGASVTLQELYNDDQLTHPPPIVEATTAGNSPNRAISATIFCNVSKR